MSVPQLAATLPKEALGQSIRRKEDDRLLSGAGCFTDDLNLPRQAYAAMVRSPHAHALIRSISTDKASAVAGVLAVDRKSTCLNSSHTVISYAVFCLKKQKEWRWG